MSKTMTQPLPTQTFAVSPPSRASWLVLVALWAGLVALNLALPHVQPAANPVPWQVMVIFGCALVVIGPYILFLHRGIAIAHGQLVVSAALCTRKVPLAALDLAQARIVALDEHTALKPLIGLFGVHLPGYRAGHVLLHNRSRAFCLLTRREHVLWLPLRDGKPSFLLSPEHPQSLLDALRAGST